MLKKSGLLRTCKKSHSCCLQESITFRHQNCQQQCRRFAVASDPVGKHHHDYIPWPDTAANAIPTPYQIFGQKKGSPYSKRTFYELVKQYHPDRHSYNGSHDGLSYASKLERYRLIVAANDLLSNPAKRSAYDCYGAGWNGQPDIRGSRDSASQGGRGGGWDSRHGPSQNATWEDWERWYQRDEAGHQEPAFASNGAFVGLILLLASIGGIAHAARAGNYSMHFIETQDARHANIARELDRMRRETTTAFPNKEERVHHFLKQRAQYGVTDPREEKHRRSLPPP